MDMNLYPTQTVDLITYPYVSGSWLGSPLVCIWLHMCRRCLEQYLFDVLAHTYLQHDIDISKIWPASYISKQTHWLLSKKLRNWSIHTTVRKAHAWHYLIEPIHTLYKTFRNRNILADMWRCGYISLSLSIKIAHTSFCTHINYQEYDSVSILILLRFHCSCYAVGFIAIQSPKINLYD